MYKKLLTLVLFLGFTAGSSVVLPHWHPVAALNDPLAPYRWQNRLLLVFVPQVSDGRLVYIRQALAEVECQFKDRDLLLGMFATDAPSRIGAESVSAYDVAALRAKFGIKSNQFAVILVGKDGQPKSELSELPEIEQIFEQIDTMPMRQQEMASRPSSCNP